MHFVGIDPGLTAPAICVMDEQGSVQHIGTIRTGNLREMERVHRILSGVLMIVEGRDCLINIEGYAFSRNAQGQRAGIEAVGVIKFHLWMMSAPTLHTIGPMQLKKYLTGNGRATKSDMIQAARDRGVAVIDDNQADAYGLALILRDAWQYAVKGVRPATLYQYEVCESLADWVREHTPKGAVASG